MKPVRLSQEADKDLEEIFDYTFQEFGLNQAIDYISGFDASFDNISQNPEIGRERTEIRENLRSLIKGKHVIFYRVLNDYIRIVRILHGSQDLVKLLD